VGEEVGEGAELRGAFEAEHRMEPRPLAVHQAEGRGPQAGQSQDQFHHLKPSAAAQSLPPAEQALPSSRS
jgi:hypothetical protein